MMSEAEFFEAITGSNDDLARVVAALRGTGQPFCLIGGLAVNRYVEPVVTLDADFAITAAAGVAEALGAAGFSVRPGSARQQTGQRRSRLGPHLREFCGQEGGALSLWIRKWHGCTPNLETSHLSRPA